MFTADALNFLCAKKYILEQATTVLHKLELLSSKLLWHQNVEFSKVPLYPNRL